MKIGIIYTAYNTIEYIKFADPFILYRKNNPGKMEIGVVSVPFEEYREITSENDGTTDYFKGLAAQNKVDFVIDNPRFIKEHEARDLVLQKLLNSNPDWILLVDADENYTYDEISRLFDYLENDFDAKLYAVHKIEFKNIVFDGTKYIKGFAPKRCFNNRLKDFSIHSVRWDNDIYFADEDTGRLYKDDEFSCNKISLKILNPRHVTWLHGEKSCSKVDYQVKHFGFSGYKYDKLTRKLNFDYEFHSRNGLAIPELFDI